MSACLTNLCSLLLKEYFGEVVQKIGLHLIKNAHLSLLALAHQTELKVDQVKKSLSVLIQHNMVNFEPNKRNIVEYGINVNRVMLLQRYPRYIYIAKSLYGDSAELLVEELLQNGQMTMEQLVEKVTERLNEAIEDSNGISQNVVKEKFVNLVNTQFFQRCPAVMSSSDQDGNARIPIFTTSTEHWFTIPKDDSSDVGNKRKHEDDDDDDEPTAKKSRLSINKKKKKRSDDDIYWMVNFDRFHRYIRDQIIISAVARKIDVKASEIIRAILRISELKTHPMGTFTIPISAAEIVKALPAELNLKPKVVDQYLSVITEDSMDVLTKTDECSGGMFSVNTKKIIASLSRTVMSSVVQERFGSQSARIFRLLLTKKYLEQEQIQTFSMTPVKESKDMTYKMMENNFLSIQELPKTPDHAPSRTFYLFTVDVNKVARMLLERNYKALFNIFTRRECEAKENKRLLDKNQRVDAIAASLKSSGADPSQTQEIEAMITPPEKEQLKKIKLMNIKLEQSELEIDETVFILQLFLEYEKTR